MAVVYRQSLDDIHLAWMQVPMESCINSAIKRGFLQQVRFLIEYGHSVNERDELHRTPLINCALIEDEKWGAGLARLFIEKGAKITMRDKRGLNALHYACVHGRKLIVDVYLEALDFDLNILDKFGNTALHYAANTGNMDICRVLIQAHKRYLQPIDIRNKRSETPLILAYKSEHIECGDLLASECQSHLDQKDIEGISGRTYREMAQCKKTNEEMNKQRDKKRRPRTAMARLERLATPKGLNHRPKTAAPAKFQNQGFSSRGKENVKADPLQLIKNSQSEFYRPASHTDLRNKPEYVFQLSPADCFVNQARYPMSDLSRTRSATHLHQIDGSSSWRDAVSQFFTSYDYQFSHSFCRGAVPPEPVVEINLEDRPDSPAPTHISEHGDSDIASLSGTSSKKLPRKISTALSAIKTMNSVVDKEKRKTSKPDRMNSLTRKMTSVGAALKAK